MDVIFLTCCVRGMEVTRHYTTELGTTIALMIGFAVVVAALVFAFSPVLLPRKAR